jgi:hypothetical protein
MLFSFASVKRVEIRVLSGLSNPDEFYIEDIRNACEELGIIIQYSYKVCNIF